MLELLSLFLILFISGTIILGVALAILFTFFQILTIFIAALPAVILIGIGVGVVALITKLVTD